jgi:hypothetical protein
MSLCFARLKKMEDATEKLRNDQRLSFFALFKHTTFSQTNTVRTVSLSYRKFLKNVLRNTTGAFTVLDHLEQFTASY